MSISKFLASTLVVATTAFSTSALAATFDFTGSNLFPASSLSFSDDGIGLTVTAGTFTTASNPSSVNVSRRLVDQDNNGLGADGFLDGDNIDGRFGNDILIFTFDQEVQLDVIRFGGVDGNDDFAFGPVDGLSFFRIVDFQDVTDPLNAATFLTGEQRVGTAFGIGAIGNNDDFTIAGLSVSSVATVPLPASGLLLGMALLGFGLVRRRKQAVA